MFKQEKRDGFFVRPVPGSPCAPKKGIRQNPGFRAVDVTLRISAWGETESDARRNLAQKLEAQKREAASIARTQAANAVRVSTT